MRVAFRGTIFAVQVDEDGTFFQLKAEVQQRFDVPIFLLEVAGWGSNERRTFRELDIPCNMLLVMGRRAAWGTRARRLRG